MANRDRSFVRLALIAAAVTFGMIIIGAITLAIMTKLSGDKLTLPRREWLPIHEYGTISLNSDEMANSKGLVGTLAHELAHQRLLGEGRLDPFVCDNELLTDPLVVFKGLGIFLANLPRTWDGQFGYWPDSELRKPEYMTSPMFGYVFGLMAWLRGEDRRGTGT